MYNNFKKYKTVDFNEEKIYLLKTIIIAISLRLVMLSIIYYLSNIISPYLYIDDKTYEIYAKSYAKIANKIIDFDAYRLVDKQIGGVVVAQLYFRFNASVYYLTRSTVLLRMINILFSSLSIIPIYEISKEIFGLKEAKTAALIFAVMPYHILMSSFVFKDISIILFMALSLDIIIKFYKYGKINIVIFLSYILFLTWLRPGLNLFLLGILLISYLLRLYNRYEIKKDSKKQKIFVITFIAICIIAVIIFRNNIIMLISRFNIYLKNGRHDGNRIKLIRIDKISQLYKLPLTWFFSTFFPISFKFSISSWQDILGVVNYSSFYVGIAYIGYSIFYKKTKLQKVFYYPMLILHLLVIIVVINVPRHYYFLHFYIIICASAFINSLDKHDLRRYLSVTTLLIFGLLIINVITQM